MIRYASVCSGVGTCALAWRPLGWDTAWFAEIAAAPSAILAHRFPEVPNYGDMLALLERALAVDLVKESLLRGNRPDDFDIDLLAGGTPCQAFSIAGKRRSLEDARGNLSLAFCELAHAIDAIRSARGHLGGLPFVVWENVPGVLSTRDNAFGCFLGGLVGADQPVLPDGGWKRAGLVVGPRRSAAYRVLDAQYFSLAQRRERVVVVSCSRASGYDPAALLLEWEGVRRDSAPSRGAGARVAGRATTSAPGSSGGGLPVSVAMASDPITAIDQAQPITCRNGDPGVVGQPTAYGIARDCLDRSGEAASGSAADRSGLGITEKCSPAITAKGAPAVAHALTGEGADASEDGSGRGTPLVVQAIPILEPGRRSGVSTTDPRCGMGIGSAGDPMFTVTADRPHGVGQPIPFDTTHITHPENRSRCEPGAPCHALPARAHAPAIAFICKDHGADATVDLAPTLRAMGHDGSHANAGGQMAVAERMLVRRLTPVECERLQGYPDGHTAVPRGKAGKVMHDGPRYKAIGNGWARPVFEWVGRRIDAAVSRSGGTATC